MTLLKHLGGHGNKTHIDEGALIYLKKAFDVSLMLDVGCGLGGMIDIASIHQIVAVGIDGDNEVKRRHDLSQKVIIHDYTKGNATLHAFFDLIWSVEFLEHVEEKYLSNIFHTFKKAKYVFCTASPKKGHHHVNIQPTSYWIKKFEEEGFEYLKKETEEVKVVSTMKREFVRNTGMIFKNNWL